MDSCLFAATAAPLISRPSTFPVPSVAWTVLAVTAPPNSETELSSTVADRHAEPCARKPAKLSTDSRDVAYVDGPGVEAGVPAAIAGRDGRTSASAPATAHPAGNAEDASGAYDGVVVVPGLVVVVVVAAVVVVSVVVVSLVVDSVVVEVVTVVVVVSVSPARSSPAARATRPRERPQQRKGLAARPRSASGMCRSRASSAAIDTLFLLSPGSRTRPFWSVDFRS